MARVELQGSVKIEATADTRTGASAAPRPATVCLISLYLSESLAVRQLCASLKAHGHRCSLIFFKEFRWEMFRPVTAREEELLFSLLGDLKPDLVGISLTSSLVADLAYDLADKIRARTAAKVIVGGAHPSVLPEEALEHADFVCRGEGEDAILEVADAIANGGGFDRIANIWTKSDGEVAHNDVRPLEANLDLLPFVAFGDPDSYRIEEDRLDRTDPATQIPLYHTTASRMACPFNCTFCGGPWLRRVLYAGKGQPRRYRSVGHILGEIRQARQRHPGIQQIQFWDEVFAVRAPEGWLDEFCERFPREIGLPFAIWSHPGLLTEPTIEKLKRAGLKKVVMGVESGSQHVRRQVLNRKETDAAILRSADILKRHGIEVGYDFIVDIPWLTEENLRGTFSLIMQLPEPFEVGIHSLSFLPGTAITERALAEGKISKEQVSRANQPLPERFESHLWKSGLSARSRSSAFWHSMIYLASVPLVPKPLLWRAYRWSALFKVLPGPVMIAAEAARMKTETGEVKLWEALNAVHPRLGGFLARHPRLGALVNRVVRKIGRWGYRLVAR
ncbi:MAG: radical SAM protein [Armatimonadota bacterium]